MTDHAIANTYDALYAAAPRSRTLGRIWREYVFGSTYPIGFEHASFITTSELARMVSELDLNPGATLVDLACGAGGPGLWIARQSRTRLFGTDFSAVGIAHARARAEAVEAGAPRARFAVATLENTPLRTASVDAAMSVDALQYLSDKRTALQETARVLRSGGRFVFTAFELEPQQVAAVPLFGLDPVADYGPLLKEAGFVLHAYDETRGWRERVNATMQAVLDALPALTDEIGEPAAAALAFEASTILQRQAYRRRVFGSAVKS